MSDLQPGENPFAQKEIESGVNPFEIPEGQNPFEESPGVLARDISLEDSIAAYSDKPFLERVLIAPIDLAAGIVETGATAIPMLATGVEHGVRQLYGKAGKNLSGDELQKYASDSWVQKNVAPELSPETITGKAIAKGFEKGVMDLPLNIYAATKAALSGTGLSGAQDIINKEGEGFKEWSNPILEVGLSAAGMHGIKKSMSSPTEINKPTVQESISKPTPTPKPKQAEPTIDQTISKPVEMQLVEQGIKQVDARINSILDTVTRLGEKGEIDPSKNAVLEGLQEQLNKLVEQKEQLERIAAGKDPIPDVAGDVKRMEIIKAAKERNPTKQLGEPTQEDVARIDEILAKQPIPEETPIIRPENGIDTITIPEAVEPKVTPFEVALQKITEAKNMVPAELADRIQTTQERIDMLGDNSRTSSLRENLVAELSAYEDIKAGREPDLSWFDNTKPVEGNIESITVEPPKPQVETIPDILAHGGEITTHFENALHLFDNDGVSGTFFDKRINETQQGKDLSKITQHFINTVGLGKDNIYIVFDDIMANKADREILADANYYGNTSVIRMNSDRIIKSLDGVDFSGVDFKGLTGKHLANAQQTYMHVRVAAHEVGHVLFNRYLQTFIGSKADFDSLVAQFNEYKKQNKIDPTSMFDFRRGTVKTDAQGGLSVHPQAKIMKNQRAFHEFFAEQATRVLLHDHVLGAFRKGVSKVFNKLIEASVELLRKAGVDIKRNNFATQIVNDIIEANKRTIEDTGETVFEAMERSNNDRVLEGLEPSYFQGQTLKDVLDYTKKQGFLLKDNPFMALDLKDIPTVSVRLAHALGKGTAVLSRKFFDRMNQNEFNAKDPHVTASYWKMRDADIQVEEVTNKLWYGDVNTKDVKWYNTYTKVKNADSPFIALNKATDMDMYVIHELHEKGFREGLNHDTNLTQNGNHLTPDQKKYYKTFSKLFDTQYDEVTKIQNELGKKHILPKRPGYYPAARSGNYSVTINYGDLISHAQQFNTRLQAEKFKAEMEKAGLKHHIVSEVVDLKDQPFQTNADMAEIIRDILAQKLPSGKDFIEKEVQRLLDVMATRGGKLGQHHKFRLNISGAKGSEFFRTPEELGKSYREAIEQSIAETGMQLRQLIYKTKIDPILNNAEFKKNKPNSHAVIQQMYDSALGRNDNLFADPGKKVDYLLDKTADEVAKAFGSEKTSDTSMGTITQNIVKEGFYYTKMMPKMVFSIIGQYLLMPSGTVSHMSKGGHGLMAYKSFTKGILKLVSGDKDLWNSIKEVSQRTNTFEPQFVEAISLQDAGHPIYKRTKDWLFLQAPGKVAESSSRIGTYAILYTHYRDLGMHPTIAANKAIEGTGNILFLYDKANSAPIFEHMGAAGNLVKPIQGFGQHMLGYVLAMIKNTSPKDYKTWGPLVNFTLLTIATTGVMGLPFIQEYEKLRRYVNKTFNDFSLPSILDIFAKDDSFLDRTLPLSTEDRAAIMLGGLSYSGMDLASSGRSNETLPSLILGVMAGADDTTNLMPIYEWALKTPGAALTLGQAVAGKASVADTAKAFDTLAPAGHLGYMIKEVAGVNKTNIMGKETNQKILGKEAQANGKRTKMDFAAGLLGTKTTEQRYNDAVQFQNAEDEQNLKAKLDRLGVRFTETGNPEYVRKMAELGATKEQIESKVKLEMFNRLVPQDVRLMINQNGKMIKGKGQRAAKGLFNFRGER